MINPTAIPDFMHALGAIVSGDLRTDQFSKILYSTDASMYQQMPHGVLIPNSAEDVHAAIELAHRYEMPILARAGGTSLAGQCTNEALVIDATKHLNKVIELNVEERWVRVQPGLVLDQLNRYLRPHGLQFGPDPASSSRSAIGGIVSNNSTGSHSIVYGMTADHVLEMQVVLSDGSWTTLAPKSTQQLLQYQAQSGLEAEIYRQFAALTFNENNREMIAAGTPRHWRRCGGYNLDRFIDGEGVTFKWPNRPNFNLANVVCGAEGTLAVITEVKLNLVPIPKHSAVCVLHYDSIREALESVPIVLEVEPSAIELVDNIGLTRAREVPEYARLMAAFIEGNPNCVNITEFYGESEAEAHDKIAKLRQHLQQRGVNVTAITSAETAQMKADVWQVRKVALGFLMGIKGDHKPVPFIEDSAVPVEHLAEYIERLETFCHSIDTPVAYYAHVSAGCLHVRPLINNKLLSDNDKMPLIISFAIELLGEYGGALSSEHGDGKARSWANRAFFGDDLYRLYCETKTIFDPNNILNPGNVVDSADMRDHLRFGSDYRIAIPLREDLDFSVDQGYHRAIEMCNGAGVCRKPDEGTMCPPYMVTLEESASTRGRANALRAAISGQLPVGEYRGERLHEMMDLCISCKACKAECPSSVDMAKIKMQYQAHYYEQHRVPLRSRLFANIGRISQLASRFPTLANAGLQNSLMRKVLANYVGISAERELPKFAHESLPTWFAKRPAQPKSATHGRIVFLTDTYSSYNDTAVAQAAIIVMERLGYEVILSGQTCLGRPAMSKGLIGQAKKQAAASLDRLAPFARQGLPIVGVEPSDISAIRDDYAYLIDDPRLPLVAAQCLTFEEFIDRFIAENGLPASFDQSPKQVLLHGHCHQKALIGTKPTHRMLAALGCEVVEIDSGCCGMAGSFGYEKEHYAISLKMAERRLLPAVRCVSAETVVVAAGVSCREQIDHGAKTRAIHPAQLMYDALLDK